MTSQIRAPATATATARKYLSLLPPHFSRTTKTKQVEFAHEAQGTSYDLVSFSQPLQPLGTPDIGLNAFAVRNDDDSVALIGALAPTDEHMEQLRSLGELTDIVVNSSSPEHWLYAPALADRFPEATLWVLPGFLDGSTGVPIPGRRWLFGNARRRGVVKEIGVDEGFPACLTPVVFSVKFFAEAAIEIKPAKAIVLSDLALKLDRDDYPDANRFGLAEKAGIWGKVGAITRVVLEENPIEARRFLRSVSELPYRHLLLSHATAVVPDGRDELEQAFSFLDSEEA